MSKFSNSYFTKDEDIIQLCPKKKKTSSCLKHHCVQEQQPPCTRSRNHYVPMHKVAQNETLSRTIVNLGYRIYAELQIVHNYKSSMHNEMYIYKSKTHGKMHGSKLRITSQLGICAHVAKEPHSCIMKCRHTLDPCLLFILIRRSRTDRRGNKLHKSPHTDIKPLIRSLLRLCAHADYSCVIGRNLNNIT